MGKFATWASTGIVARGPFSSYGRPPVVGSVGGAVFMTESVGSSLGTGLPKCFG